MPATWRDITGFSRLMFIVEFGSLWFMGNSEWGLTATLRRALIEPKREYETPSWSANTVPEIVKVTAESAQAGQKRAAEEAATEPGQAKHARTEEPGAAAQAGQKRAAEETGTEPGQAKHARTEETAEKRKHDEIEAEAPAPAAQPAVPAAPAPNAVDIAFKTKRAKAEKVEGK